MGSEMCIRDSARAIALGYEGVNDRDRLRLAPLLANVAGKIDPKGSSRKRQADTCLALASPATLHQLAWLIHQGLRQGVGRGR